jgi:hypothetical protein
MTDDGSIYSGDDDIKNQKEKKVHISKFYSILADVDD